MKKIKFKDNEYLFIGDELKDGGAIATQSAYENGEVSFAHLMANGDIKRFNSVIGNIDDINIVGEVPDDDLNIGEHSYTNLFKNYMEYL